MNAANKPSVAAHDSASAAKAKVGENLLDRIGNTPLLRLERIVPGFPNVEFYAKAEWFNPGGSVKDRAALRHDPRGERSGDLRPGKIILDATSGNTGIAYAMIGAALGYRVKLCLPANVIAERKRILAPTARRSSSPPADEGSDGAIRRAREIYAADPRQIFLPRPVQQSRELARALHDHRPRNLGADRRHASPISSRASAPAAHSSAPRAASRNSIPRFAASVFSPTPPFTASKAGSTWRPPSCRASTIRRLADDDLAVRTEDAYRLVTPPRARRRHARRAPVPPRRCGLHATLLRRLPAGERAVIVTIFPDSGEKYLSERFWSEA